MALIWEHEPQIRYHATGEEEVQLLAMIRTMRQVVEEAGPDFVYQKVDDHSVINADYPEMTHAKYAACVYVRDGKPDCIGARVLVRMGVPLETLSSIEGKWATDLSDKPGNTLLKPTLRLITAAQILQDSGTPWGAVLQHVQEKLLTSYGVRA